MPSLRRRIVISGHAFRVVESASASDRDGPVLVLVHGIGMSHRYLSRLHDVLAPTGRVLSIDLPGFGGLPKPSTDIDIPTMGRMIADLVRALTPRHVVLIGHSMGAQWVLEAGRALSDRVRDVILIGPVADEARRTVGAQARALGVDTLRETPAINATVFTDYLRCGPRWYLTQLRHMLSYPTDEAVRAARAPITVIRGAGDPIAGERWCRVLSRIARAGRLIEIEGQHHVVQQSAPHAVASAILDAMGVSEGVA